MDVVGVMAAWSDPVYVCIVHSIGRHCHCLPIQVQVHVQVDVQVQVMKFIFEGGHPVVFRQLFIILVPSIHNKYKDQMY